MFQSSVASIFRVWHPGRVATSDGISVLQCQAIGIVSAIQWAEYWVLQTRRVGEVASGCV